MTFYVLTYLIKDSFQTNIVVRKNLLDYFISKNYEVCKNTFVTF